MQSADWAVWAAWKLQTFKPQSPDNPLGHCREHSGAWVVSDLTSWTPPPHCSRPSREITAEGCGSQGEMKPVISLPSTGVWRDIFCMVF